MAPEPAADRWAAVEALYQSVCDLPVERREAVLASGDLDPDVRREVEALLHHDGPGHDFLERPALEVAVAHLARDHAPLSAGRRVGGYEIVALIGSGGMGEVYRARDLQLERDVALKVVFRDDDPTNARRFEDEARAASALSHPGIVTIYAVGEDDDLAYIAMELVTGETMHARQARTPLSLEDAWDLAVQLSDAIAVAHEAGIVHRDLKPDNVMITTDGRLKVLDFGIAKRPGAPQLDADRVRGTAGYMAPEQARGDVTDHRTDQFAFGAILYELLTTQRAFSGDTLADTIDAVMSSAPRPIAALNPDVPSALQTVVNRCLAKSPADRWPSSRDLAVELRQGRDRWRRDEDMRKMRRRVWWLVAAASASLVTGVSAWKIWQGGPRARSIAVLPLVNSDGNADIDYICDGLTENVLRQLMFVPALDVRPRSVVFNFRGDADARDAGRRMAVDVVLAGTVSTAGGRLRVNARLIDVATGGELWSDHYDRPIADAPATSHDLARAIVAEGIRQPLDRSSRRLLEQPPTENATAYDAYLRGVHLHRLDGERNVLAARQLLQQAVAIDPSFALAQVSLASTFTVMTVDGYERPTEAWPASNRCVRRALEVDADLPEAHAEQASSWFFFDHDWVAAESAWKRAISVRPSPALPDLLAASALKVWAIGRAADAIAFMRRARQLDSLTPRFAVQEADLLLNDGHASEAAAIYEAVIAAHPDEARAHFGLADAYMDAGHSSQAIRARLRGYDALGQTPPPHKGATDSAAYQSLDRSAAERDLEALTARATRGEYACPLDAARAHARLGNREAAFRALDAALEDQSPGLAFLRVDRAWRAVRDDARFQAAVTVVGLP